MIPSTNCMQSYFGTLIASIRYALRQFWVSRVFTAAAVGTLALGIGGTTAIFTLIHGWGLNRPARPMFYAPLAQGVDCKDDLMRRIDLQSHFVRGIMLVTGMRPGALEPLMTKTLS